MEDQVLERVIISSIKIGTIATLKSLGLLSEVVKSADAERIYTRKLISIWRSKGWITGYPTGNSKRGKIYYKRSELELASVMLELGNVIPENKLFKDLYR